MVQSNEKQANQLYTCTDTVEDALQYVDTNKQQQFWKDKPPTIESMLGAAINQQDVLLRNMQIICQFAGTKLPKNSICVDVGSGIGRFGQVMSKYMDVDMIEPDAKFYKKAMETGCYLQETSQNMLAQEATYTKDRYMFAWIWDVCLYLNDDQLLSLLNQLWESMKHGGVLYITENITESKYVFDESDHSIIRPETAFNNLFGNSKFSIDQRRWPDSCDGLSTKEILKMKRFVLKK